MNTPATETCSPSSSDSSRREQAASLVAAQATEDILELDLRRSSSREVVYTIVKHAILTAMKTTNMLPLLVVLLFAGCTTVITPQGQQYRVIETGYSVVNNTGCLLDVVQDGVTICTGLETGRVLPLRNPLWRNKTVVTVIGHDQAGNYVGTETWTFIGETPEAWTVTRLVRPRL